MFFFFLNFNGKQNNGATGFRYLEWCPTAPLESNDYVRLACCLFLGPYFSYVEGLSLRFLAQICTLQ